MSKNKIDRTILIDEPTTQDFFHGKGHERTAQALVSAIRNFKSSDGAIGLDGPWGSGKSSVVAIAQKSLNAGARGTNFHFFTFDIWSSQGASFRRSFLEHFIRWAKSEFPKKFSQLEKIDNEVRGKTKVINSSNKSVLDWYGIVILLFVPILPIYYFWAKGFYDSAPVIATFMVSQPMVVFYIFLFITIIRAGLRFCSYLKNDLSGVDASTHNGGRLFQMALSQTLLISTKSYEDQTVTEHIREVDPNDFEFQATLRRVLSTLQDDDNKIVVVLDNIDRLPKDEIDDYWALVRSVFSRGGTTTKPKSVETITAIVPYDRHLIGASDILPLQKNDEKGDQKKKGLRSIRSREIFSKTFDEILVVAPPVMSNSREFFQEKMKQALPAFSDNDELIRVYLIFNHIILNENGKSTPRQILSFINELTGIYVLHEGRVRLATIAVFIAHQDDLELNPTSLTDKEFIDERFRTIAADPDLEKNLAALIFNVEPDLAFQILLDDQIRLASVAATPDMLRQISDAPGFDLRVGEVITSRVREWQEAGEFGAAITNYAALVKSSSAIGRDQYLDILVNAFFDLGSIGLTATEYSPYLKILNLTRQVRLPDVVRHFVSLLYTHARLNNTSEVLDGVRVGEAILAIQNAASEDGRLSLIAKALPDFPKELQAGGVLFGIAQTIRGSSISLKSMGIRTLGVPDESTYLADMATKVPADSLRALVEFKAAGLIKETQWVRISNAILEKLTQDSDEFDGEPSELLVLLREAWISTGNKRGEVNVKAAVDNVNLFDNLFNSFGDGKNDNGLEVAAVIFGQEMIKDGYRTVDPIENGEGYKWFTDILSGEILLSDEMYIQAGRTIVESGQSGIWTDLGDQHQPNKFISKLVENIYTIQYAPDIYFDVFFRCYEYVREVVDGKLPTVLKKLDDRAATEDFDFVTFENIPLSLINDSYKHGGEGWKGLHKKIEEMFVSVSDATWAQELERPNVISSVLVEKIRTSGFLIDATIYRSSLENFVLGILNGDAQSGDFNYDLFFEAVDKNFHPDMYRKIRESLTSVSVASLAIAQERFPKFLNALISGGDRISKNEKDSIVRNLLAPALEGRNADVLGYFVGLGSVKVREFVKSANDSTQKRISGAEAAFHKGHRDYIYAQSIADLLHGKKKARTFLEAFWGGGARED